MRNLIHSVLYFLLLVPYATAVLANGQGKLTAAQANQASSLPTAKDDLQRYQVRIAADPKNADLRYEFSEFLARLNLRGPAEHQMRAAFEIDHNSERYWLKVARFKAQTGDFKGASAAYRKAGPAYRADWEFADRYADKVGDFGAEQKLRRTQR